MRWRNWTGIAACGFVLAAGAEAQYPGRVSKTDKAAPILRAVSVLEWVGEAGKPSASRMVPVAVFDGEQLNDGTLYMSRPAPLALSGGVEYELQTAGKPMGLFDVFAAGEMDGAWRGFGVWKPLSAKDAAAAAAGFNSSALAAPVHMEDDDRPVLKRKHPKGSDEDDDSGTKPAGGSSDTAAKPTARSTSAESDPDRPTLKRKSGDDAGGSAAQKPAPVGEDDPDRPTIRRSRKSVSDAAMAETSTVEPDPDRPRLKRGRPEDLGAPEPPKLEGLPPAMQQAVAVSDGRTRPEHPWKFTWADPADEQKMKTALEAIARTALGLDAPPPKPVHRTTATGKRVIKPAPVAAAPVELADERFQSFELTFGSSATLVLTASSSQVAPAPPAVVKAAGNGTGAIVADGPPVIRRGKPTTTASKPKGPTVIAPAAPAAKAAPQKFVTLIAQPDLYGGVIVVFKSVTDSAHLDVTPRMRLIDAVDAEADNRGELLFELRGAGQRQFALYRVTRGSAEQMFATVGIP